MAAGPLSQANAVSLLRCLPINSRQSCAAAPGYGWQSLRVCDSAKGERRSNIPTRMKLSEWIGVMSKMTLSVNVLRRR
jgi:hypothetical protein